MSIWGFLSTKLYDLRLHAIVHLQMLPGTAWAAYDLALELCGDRHNALLHHFVDQLWRCAGLDVVRCHLGASQLDVLTPVLSWTG